MYLFDLLLSTLDLCTWLFPFGHPSLSFFVNSPPPPNIIVAPLMYVPSLKLPHPPYYLAFPPFSGGGGVAGGAMI